ncbi:hypothetical protein NERG_00673 [Nematocida ausubeli]|uniref:Uncharacterized protein n=1 Tax=Nematocida ausubeli (strain ATCC PRA-371 / ERTm2) TaxID=1913371 RepID=H8ZAS4_NEMA1|nr:hypothetical protein NERG_00673 [Nematocida ausubeli]
MLTSKWVMEKITEVTNHCFSKMTVQETNAVTGMLIAFLFGMVTPHITNRFFIREVFNVLSGAIVLSAIYKIQNFLVALSGIPLNLLLSYMPVKQKKLRTKIFIAVNLVHLVVMYILQDSEENNPFVILTLTGFFMKYMYVSMEYLPKTHGFMAYLGYMFFVPGIRYGPVMSFSAYQLWLESGYFYLVESQSQTVIKKIVGNTEDQKKITNRKEEYVMQEYSRLIVGSTVSCLKAFIFLISYQAVNEIIMNAAAHTMKLVKVDVDFSGFYIYKLFYIAALWISEECIYQAAFINNMRNVRILPFVTFWKAQELFEMWNMQGSKFMHRLNKMLTSDEKKEKETDSSKQENTKESEISASDVMDMRIKEHVKVSIVSYAHLLLFPLHIGSILISVPTIFLLGFVKDIPIERRNIPGIKILVEICGWAAHIFIFCYFLIPMVYSPLEVLNIWRKSFAFGHFVCLPGIIEGVLSTRDISTAQTEAN